MFALHGLRSLPFWTSPEPSKEEKADDRARVAYNDPTITAMLKHLEANTEDIKAEYMEAVLGIGSTMSDTNHKSQLVSDYDTASAGAEHPESLHKGNWEWHSYIQKGERNPTFKDRCPKTAKVLDELGPLLFSTPFSFAFFSTLHGKSKIEAHNGPMNLRLRVHLPLIVPSKPASLGASTSGGTLTGGGGTLVDQCGIRVGSQRRNWVEGKAIVLDDSYQHEVWNKTEEPRVVFLFDIWHPDVEAQEKESINDMFSYARGKGWIGNKK